MRPMGRTVSTPLRSLIAALLLAAVVLPLRLPACAPQVCPLDEAARGACRELDGGCCQVQGESAGAVAASLPPVVPAFQPLAPLALPSPVMPPSEPLAAPAVVQGVGLHTLFAVFLI
jgi:hypothetical protein